MSASDRRVLRDFAHKAALGFAGGLIVWTLLEFPSWGLT